MKKYSYDINKYNFVDLVRQCFKVDDLEKIHLNLDNERIKTTICYTNSI